jgi:NTP pyrophosphatase (non-canonical NTP hydrolase)
MSDFYSQVKKFNEMYGLEYYDQPHLLKSQVLASFQKILRDELEEAWEILDTYNESPIKTLTAIADWLGDIIVYCNTFAARFGIPLPEILNVIMQSNFSKLGADGKPIYDPDTGKVLKGPMYWKPEPMIEEILRKRMKDADS